MASSDDLDELEDEVMELLQHYKHKKATVCEPCTVHNYKECLIGLYEEFGNLNINYIFNPHLDLENETLTTEALVKLVNATYTMLYQYKSKIERSESLAERNQLLENNNKQMDITIENLKRKIISEKNEAKACIASAKRIADNSDTLHATLTDTQAKLAMITKQKQSKEKSLMNEITRLKHENDKLNDRLRNKSDSFTPCAEVCESTLSTLRRNERRQRNAITKLQNNNQQLLQEVLDLKDDIVLSGLDHCDIRKK